MVLVLIRQTMLTFFAVCVTDMIYSVTQTFFFTQQTMSEQLFSFLLAV